MVRLGAVTHSVNMEQRYVPLSFTAGGGNLTATAPLNANIAPPGYYMLFVIGTDGVPSVASMVRVENDTSPPATPSLTDTDPDSPANDNNPEVKGSAEAGSTVKIYSSSDCSGSPLASGSAATFSGAGITTPVPSNQTTNLRASATDAAGNASGCSTALAYTHDSSAPATPSLTDTDPDSPANDNNPEVKGTAEAGSTVSIYSTAGCTGSPLASGSAASFNGAGITTPVAGDQTTNLRATATDSVNNASGCSSALAYTEDSTAPNTQVDSGPQGPTNDPTPSFGFSATGGAQSYECRFDSGSFGPCSGPGDTHTASPQLSDGAHTFEVRATDSAQNTDPTPASRSFTVDTAAPNTQVDSGPQGPTNDPTPSFGFSATGGAQSYECRFDSGSFGPCSGPGDTHTASPQLSDGAHTFEVRATDSAQNTDPTPASRAFTVDTSAPNTQVDSGPQGPTSNNDPSFAFSSSESNSSFECRLDGPGAATGTFTSCTSPRAFTDLADGTYTFQVRATDSVGNTDGSAATRSFTVDTIAPATPSLTDTDPDSPANDNNPEVKGSAEAGSTVRIYSTAGCTGSPLASGSAASFNGAGITTPVAGDQTTNLRATATDSVNNASGCSSALAYTEDSTAPNTQVDSGPQGPTNDPTPSFGFSATGGAQSFECRFDSASFGPCSGPGDTPTASPQLSDGAHTFEVRATDSAQNTDPTPASRAFTVDTAAPNTQVDSGPQGPTSNNDPSFAFSSSESNSSFECRLDGPGAATGTFASCTSPRAFTDLADGTYTFQVRATDSVGNTDGSAATRSFTVDTAAPSLSITSGPSGPTNNASPGFGFNAESGSTVQCSIDQGSANFGSCSSSSSHSPGSPLADGPYTFRVRASDAAGNQATQTRAFTVDTAAPNTSIDSGPQGPTNEQRPRASASRQASEAQSFECRFDRPRRGHRNLRFLHLPRAFAHLADGTYTFEVRATDSAQNTDPTPASRAFTVDTAAPNTQVDSGPQGPTNDPTPSFGFSATGGAQSYECRFDSASFGPCSGPGDTHTASPQLSDGAHTFEVRATDSAQNTDPTPASRAFTVDTAAPNTSIDSGPQGPTNEQRPQLRLLVKRAPTSYECRLDSAPAQPLGTWRLLHLAQSLADLADGAHTFEVRATDSAQNTDPTPASRAFTVDTAAPNTSIDSGPQGPTNDPTPSFGFSATGGAQSYECRFDSASFGPCSGPGDTHTASPQLSDGAHSFEVRATDSAQNTDPTPASRAFTVDTAAPNTSIDSGPQGPTNDPTPSFGFSATGGAQSYECRFDSASFGPCSGPGDTHTASPQLSDGAHSFEVRATDSAQNTDPTPASRSFTVDTAAPAAPSLTDTDPDSPANDNNPEVKGSAEAGSTVRIYSSSDCSGLPLASGTAGELDSPGLTVNVAADQTTSLRARASDRAGNESGCSAAIEYTEDSTPPDTELTDAPPPESAKRKVKFAFSSTEAQSTFRCSFDKATMKHCKPPLTKRVARGTHVFRVYALDRSGNADATPAKVKFKVIANR